MKNKIGLIIFLVVVFLGLVAIVVLQTINTKEKNKIINELQAQYNAESNSYRKLKMVKDSLVNINALLAKYRILTDAMTYRDSVRQPFAYKVGDIVYLKRDSSQAVISDIIVGGSAHEYYIKYKVVLKNNTSEDIIPELLY